MAEDFYDLAGASMRQGDIFENVPFVWLANSATGDLEPRLTATRIRGMLLNQSCEVDKPGTEKLILLPVLNLDRLAAQNQANVRKNKVYAQLFLPQYRNILPDSFVQFTEPVVFDKQSAQGMSRLVSLSEKGRRALYFQHLRWLSRWALREVACPSCGVLFDPAETLPVQND